MEKELAKILEKIGNGFKKEILPESKIYCIIDIGQAAENFGKPELKEEYKDINAVIPLKKAKGDWGFEVDGTGLSDYAQLESGIAVPKYIAEKSGLPNKKYQPKEKMFLY